MSKLNIFDNLSYVWWTESKFSIKLHELNLLRVSYIKKNFNLNGRRILDVGCGAGILSESLFNYGSFITGVDSSEFMIENAKSRLRNKRNSIKYKILDVKNLINSNIGKFDLIVCMELLEHIDCINFLIYSFKCLLNENGCIFISTLNKTFVSFLSIIAGGEYLYKFLPKGTHSYDKFISFLKLRDILGKNSFVIKDIIGIKYDFFSKRLIFCKDYSSNYIVYASLK